MWLRNAWKLNRALDKDYDTSAWFSAAPQLTVSLVREAIRAGEFFYVPLHITRIVLTV